MIKKKNLLETCTKGISLVKRHFKGKLVFVLFNFYCTTLVSCLVTKLYSFNYFREEKRTANIICDDESGVICLVIDRDSFNQMIANLEDIKTKYMDLPERKKM